jgi:Nucleotidyl transferase of unknown function (DUF2204)
MTQFDPIFAALQATGVRYVVVGGVAVNLHGYQRFTKDIDLVIELVPDQALKALEALQDLGYNTKIDLPETSLRIASIDHLVLMKRQAGRPQDLLDVEKLEKLKQIMAERGDAPK